MTTNDRAAETAIKSILKSYPDFDIKTLIDSEPQKLLNAAQAQKFLGGISRMSLWRINVVKEEIPSVMVGGRVMFELKDLQDFIKRNKKHAVSSRAI